MTSAHILGHAPIPPRTLDLSNYVVVDVETTGVYIMKNNRYCDVIEVGALRVCQNQPVGCFQSLVRWWMRPVIPQLITDLTGISEEMILREGRRPEEVMREFLEFIGDLPLVAHNAAFDRGFLLSMWERSQQRCYDKQLTPLPEFNPDFFDTLAMSRRLYPAPHNLGKLATRLNIEVKVAHRALADCYTAHALLQTMMGEADWNKWWVNRRGWMLADKK